MFQLASRLVVVSGVALVTLLVAGGASAIPQFTPSATALLHSIGSGQPGAAYNSGGLGSGGQIDYTNLGGGAGTLNITAGLNRLNYYDGANGSCSTDVGSNCFHQFDLVGQNLDFMVNANLVGVNVTPAGGTFIQIDIQFESTGLGNDFTWTDPLDGNSDMLTATWTSGLFMGVPTTGLEASVLYDTSTMMPAFGGDVSVVGFATIQSGLYEDMFGTDRVALDVSTFFDFAPVFADITQAVIDTGEIPDFTAEIQGQIFRVGTGEFVPEPGTALLLGVGLYAIGRRSRRS